MLGVFALVCGVLCDTHAVLIAGSNGYRNYRHQADVFQMYQVLIKRKLDPKNIILMAYDDVVNATENVKPGKVFGLKKHVNVYPGADKIDWRGNNVSTEVLAAVLTGNTTIGGKVLTSTENDDVFFYYNDHGTRGFLCMPWGSGGHLSANKLREIILEMQKKKMFRKLFIAIEACYSGSIGKELADLENVSIICAANDSQSSYSFGYDYDIKTFRTNEFTYNFFQSILKFPNTTLAELFKMTKEGTHGSEVQSFGDKGIKIANFMGEDDPVDWEFENAELYEETEEKVSSMLTEIEYLKQGVKTATTPEEKKAWKRKLYDELLRRGKSKAALNRIAAPFTGGNVKDVAYDYPNSPQWKCYEKTVEAFRARCGDFSEYEYDRVSMFAKLCEDYTAEEIIGRIKFVCPTKQW